MVLVKNFAVKELEKGHMNDDLAIIYEEIRRISDQQEWDQIKGESEYCYKVHTAGSHMSMVRVLQNVPETIRQRAPVQEGRAYIYLYRQPYVILYEDTSGSLYTAKDSYRLKEEITLPSNKGNISELLYSEVELKNVDVRLFADKFTLKGEASVFFLYQSEDEENPMEYYETEIPFSVSIDCGGCDEDMIEDIDVGIAGRNLEIKPDADGEERIVDAEIVFDMNIKIYREEEFEILADIYSPVQEIVPARETMEYENLLIKNNTKARITDRIRLGSGNPRVLQICHGSGTVKIDETQITSEGIMADGVIEVELLYISADDLRPLQAMKSAVPFSQLIEVRGITPESIFEIRPGLEQIGVMMLDAEEIEIKAGLRLNTIVFDPVSEPVITDLTVNEPDMEKLQSMPGLIGYVVREGDTLWDIARRYYTTMDTIREINGLESDQLHPGDRILMIKQVESVFG